MEATARPPTTPKRGQIVHKPSTADRIGREHGVSGRTVRRSAQFVTALDALEAAGVEYDLRGKIRRKERTAPQSAVILAAEVLPFWPDLTRALLDRKMTVADARRFLHRIDLEARVDEAEDAVASQTFDVAVVNLPWPKDRIINPRILGILTGLNVPLVESAHVWLRAPAVHLRTALWTAEQWGLAYGGTTHVYAKADGPPEFVLYVKQGAPAFIDVDALPATFTDWPRFYDAIRTATSGRRVAMFEDGPLEGFTTVSGE